ncbi:t-SNARE, partial [Scheffersomyces amazonensis]|uniref:t-SNARE n=1 Tax=Scheffersomyces amazonensis TaxID=1078765 RepID=UPI00315C71BB
MSFANFDYEAQTNVGKLESILPNNELDIILTKTSDQVKGFGNLISQLDNQRKNIGTRRDSQVLRDKTDVLIDSMRHKNLAIDNLISELDELMNQNKKLTQAQPSSISITNKQTVNKQRLTNEYNSLIRQFEKSINLYNARKKDYPLQSIESKYSETTPLLVNDNQTQLQIQEQVPDMLDETDLQTHIYLTEERNRQIDQIHSGVQEINEIYKELHGLVQQQGDQIDSIEDNILQLQDNSQQAHRQLKQADELQRKKGKWSCLLLTVLTIVVLTIVLAVLS